MASSVPKDKLTLALHSFRLSLFTHWTCSLPVSCTCTSQHWYAPRHLYITHKLLHNMIRATVHTYVCLAVYVNHTKKTDHLPLPASLPPWTQPATLDPTCHLGHSLPPWTQPATLDPACHLGHSLPPWTQPATLDTACHLGHVQPATLDTACHLGHVQPATLDTACHLGHSLPPWTCTACHLGHVQPATLDMYSLPPWTCTACHLGRSLPPWTQPATLDTACRLAFSLAPTPFFRGPMLTSCSLSPHNTSHHAVT